MNHEEHLDLDGCQPNNTGTPKMDGENHGKPYFLMDDLGLNTPIFGNTYMGKIGRFLWMTFMILGKLV